MKRPAEDDDMTGCNIGCALVTFWLLVAALVSMAL